MMKPLSYKKQLGLPHMIKVNLGRQVLLCPNTTAYSDCLSSG